MSPVRLTQTQHEKVWGSTRLSPWYPDPADGRKIGEVWLTHEPALPLLFKFLFTTEKLSVQVHPDDERGREWENSRGKTEMWRILRADPGATIALGFKDELSPEQAREAARSGEIEQLLRWIEVKPGDMYFVPAGTVHAIGAGLALCEVQQNSDVTYRLFDYGRPRELHLEKGFAVSDLGPYLGGAVTGVQCDYFGVEEFTLNGRLNYSGGRAGRALLILNGEGQLNGQPMRGGEGWWIPGGLRVDLDAPGGVDVLEVRQP